MLILLSTKIVYNPRTVHDNMLILFLRVAYKRTSAIITVAYNHAYSQNKTKAALCIERLKYPNFEKPTF